MSTTTPASTTPDAKPEPLQGQAASPHGLADVADTPPDIALAGTSGGVVLDDSTADQAGPKPTESIAAAPLTRSESPDPKHACSWCGRQFKSGPALGGHKKNCKRRPDGGVKAEREAIAKGEKPPPPKPPPRPVDIGTAYRAPPRRARPAAAPEQPAAAAARGRDGLVNGMQSFEAAGGGLAGAGALLARLQAGAVGVPELAALACETALPPPLRDVEYQALVAVWGDEDLDIPDGVLKALVTGSIFLPRLLDHETFGPQLRQLGQRLFGGLGDGDKLARSASAAHVRPAPPPPPPPEAPAPAQPETPKAASSWDV